MTRRNSASLRSDRARLTKVGASFAAISLLMMAVACSTRDLSSAGASTAAPSGEVSLTADRRELDELRKDVPEEVRRQNDELALILKDMVPSDSGGGGQEPGKVRERFNTAVRKKRDAMDRQLKAERDAFGKNEREARETFLKKAAENRASFASRRREREERQRFFDRQDSERREFFADLSDKRREFESAIMQRRRDFEDHVREQTNEFNQAHREYTKSFYERQKAEALKKRMQEKEKNSSPQGSASGQPVSIPQDTDKALLEEMRAQQKGKVTPLKAEDK